jgi:IS5 family transposase
MRKEQFSEEMDAIIPRHRLLAAIEPHYPQVRMGLCRAPPEMMLRIHMLQYFFNSSDPAMEEPLYVVPLHLVPLYCRFVRIDLAGTWSRRHDDL